MADENTSPASLAKTVRLALPWPHHLFHHGVDGVDPITREGTDVPASLAEKVKRAWRAATAGRSEIREVTK